MTGFVLVRNEDGAFVTTPGSRKSYSKKLQDARVYPSREAAQRDACGNETPRRLADCFGGVA